MLIRKSLYVRKLGEEEFPGARSRLSYFPRFQAQQGVFAHVASHQRRRFTSSAWLKGVWGGGAPASADSVISISHGGERLLSLHEEPGSPPGLVGTHSVTRD